MNSLVYLRRMIINQKPARLDYTKGSVTKSIYYERAGFEGSHNEVAQKLREVFEADSVNVVTSTDFNPLTSKRIFAPQAISSALAGYTFNAEMRASLLSFTMRLPPLIVRLYPMQRYAFQDNSAYMKMHMQYQHNGSFRMQSYVSQAENTRDEIVRLRVMMATYILGLIAPMNAPRNENHQVTQSMLQRNAPQSRKRKTSILSRIIDRIRGL
ncbi:hypothetical protein [Mariprofundus ferrooxydans]|jgi:hypothetical protein|uniref:Uncharacterized protein n=1 Tax=Mariprofundus ferrooxydans PV-1 TaxID=314345 RepID=Q0EXV4_9PROT|nr:hypothetical protein [Mariprofundus ferrooxydans]EAU54098.1 hypothetical protein SPV1_00672 [Mariprofundus ferrooxydans PV-1]KON48900.1 hypothetical protein AL013_00780 [Mariprofundus ferrooxydans]